MYDFFFFFCLIKFVTGFLIALKKEESKTPFASPLLKNDSDTSLETQKLSNNEKVSNLWLLFEHILMPSFEIRRKCLR